MSLFLTIFVGMGCISAADSGDIQSVDVNFVDVISEAGAVNDNQSTVEGVSVNNPQSNDLNDSIEAYYVDTEFIEPNEYNNFVYEVNFDKNSPFKWIIEYSNNAEVHVCIDIINPDNTTGIFAYTFHVTDDNFVVHMNLVDDSGNIIKRKNLVNPTHYSVYVPCD